MSDIVFVDYRVTDAQDLLDDLTGQGMEIIAIDENSGGLEQMAAALTGRTDIGAIHILAQGEIGQMRLGSTELDETGLGDHVSALESIGASLGADGDILLYGSRIADGADGAAFISALADATGADVAASTNNTGSSGDWTLEATSGTVEASAIDGSGYTIESLRLADDFAGDEGDDEAHGGDGDDELDGGGGDDHLEGGRGHDHLVGGEGRDTASYAHAGGRVHVHLAEGVAEDDGDGGSDTLDGIEDVDGSDYDDDIGGDSNANHLHGSLGNDQLEGLQGDDTIDGGDGNDTASYVDALAGVIGSLASGTIQDGDGGTDTLTHVENLHGSHHDDSLSGDDGANELDGDLGNDTLRGGAGGDHLDGGAGNDVLDGGSGDDAMTGGSGNDTYVVNSAGDVVTETSTSSTQIDTVRASIGYTLRANVEHLVLTGSGVINGVGNALANLLEGNGSANRLSGGAGGDTLDGGKGLDVLTGGSGHDTFRFDTALSGTTNVDRIADFNAVDDRIAVDNAVFTRVGAVGAIGRGAFYAGHAAHDSSDRIIYDESNGHLLYDADGNGSGAAVHFATVTAHTTLTSADIWVV